QAPPEGDGGGGAVAGGRGGPDRWHVAAGAEQAGGSGGFRYHPQGGAQIPGGSEPGAVAGRAGHGGTALGSSLGGARLLRQIPGEASGRPDRAAGAGGNQAAARGAARPGRRDGPGADAPGEGLAGLQGLAGEDAG